MMEVESLEFNKSLREDAEMKAPLAVAAKKTAKRKRVESLKMEVQPATGENISTIATRSREDIEREEPFAKCIGTNFIVYARRPDISDTLIIRDTARTGTFTAFGVKGLATIKSMFQVVIKLVEDNQHLLDGARFDLDKKFNFIIDAQGKDESNNELFAIANDNAVYANIYDRSENDEVLTSITTENVRISLVTNRKCPQMAFHLLHENTKKVKAGIYMQLWDVEKLLRYMQERFSIISGLAFNVYENVQSSLVNCDNDDFF